MLKTRLFCVIFLGGSLVPPASAFSLGGKKNDASVKVTHGGELKGKTSIAVGAFRVAFVTEDAATASSHGILGGSAAKMSGELVGVDHSLMQKITDEVYADFLKKAGEKGYAVIDSQALAKASTAYAALASADNFAQGRLGTFVVPTGQRSVAMAADDRSKEEKGTGGFMTRINIVRDQVTTAPANAAFPAAAKQAGAPVLGVTLVVNFADFKGSASMGGSKASLVPGATIDGRNKNEIIPSTSIQGWGAGTGSCAACPAQFALEGQIHSDASIGAFDASGSKNDKAATITADPAAYEANVLLVAGQANDMLLAAMASAK